MTTDALQVDADVPPPQSGRRKRYPFNQLEVNQSFFVPVPGEFADDEAGAAAKLKACTTLQSVLSSSASCAAKANGFVYTTRKRIESDVLGIRVWRVS